MPRRKMKLLLEISTEILNRVFSALCHEKNIEKAEELQDIIRRLILFSDRLYKRPIVEMDAKELTDAMKTRKTNL